MSTDTSTSLPVLTANDFASDQEVRWCPGCGDYSILAQMKKVLPSAGHAAGENGVRVGHRLLQPVSLLHEHLRHPLDPRPGPGRGHGAEGHPARPVRVGHHRRRRRAEHRRQPPDARHPPQPGHQHRAVQQPHLRADQGAVFAHVAAGQDDQEHADGGDRQSSAPAVDRHRLRGHVRRPLDRHQHQAPERWC